MTARELIAWDMYFCGVVAIRFHPKNVESMVSLDTEFRQNIVRECASVADIMLEERRRRDPDAYRNHRGRGGDPE